MATDRISVRLPKDKIKFLEQVGHDPTREKGARTRGVEAVIAFAQMTPRAFRAFLNGRADPGLPQPWGFHDKFDFEIEEERCKP